MLKLRLELSNEDGTDLTTCEITDASINHFTSWPKIFWHFINGLNGLGFVVNKDLDFITDHVAEHDY
jgi:hypothetical protein